VERTLLSVALDVDLMLILMLDLDLDLDPDVALILISYLLGGFYRKKNRAFVNRHTNQSLTL
jgi:hypothetical protein